MIDKSIPNIEDSNLINSSKFDSDTFNLKKSPIDSVFGNYKIEIDKPLEEYSNDFAKAYNIRLIENLDADYYERIDEYCINLKNDSEADLPVNDYYGLVFDNRMPVRLNDILNRNFSSNVASPHYLGICQFTELKDEPYFVAILPKIKGNKLRDLLATKNLFNEKFILAKFLKNIIKILETLHNNNIVYGKINLDNIYIDPLNEIKLKEFISTPCGYDQLTLYETTARSITQKWAKGSLNTKVDYYALGMLLFCMSSGENFEKYNDIILVQEKLKSGSFNFLNKIAKLPKKISILISYLVIDNENQRWNASQIIEYLDNNTSNLTILYDRDYLTRSIIFNAEEFYCRKALALSLWLNWEQACEFIKTDKIKKWLALNASEANVLNLLESLNLYMLNDKASTQRRFTIDDERLISTLIILDSDGPVRVNGLAFFLDSIGILLAHSLNYKSDNVAQTLEDFIISNIFNIYDYMNTVEDNQPYFYIMSKLYKCSEYLGKSDIGFGLNRCLYELNPTLPAQDLLSKAIFCINLKDAMIYLNDESISFEDIQALKSLPTFIYSKIDNSDFKIRSLGYHNIIQKDKIYQLCSILSIAQTQSKLLVLNHLTNIIAEKFNNILDKYIKSNSIIKLMRKNIDKAAKSGIINNVIKIASASKFFIKDLDGFTKACKRYKELLALINIYQQKDNFNLIKITSLKIATQLTYVISCFIIIIIILENF